MSATPRLSLPFLAAGQAQKEISVNESLQTLDVLVGGAVEEPPRNDPPASPAVGTAFIVDQLPTGPWAGRTGYAAAYSEGGWRMIAPAAGMRLYVRSTDTFATFRGADWEIGTVRGSELIVDGQQVVGARRPAIAAATGGTTIDAEARAAIENILDRLRAHGLIDA